MSTKKRIPGNYVFIVFLAVSLVFSSCGIHQQSKDSNQDVSVESKNKDVSKEMAQVSFLNNNHLEALQVVAILYDESNVIDTTQQVLLEVGSQLQFQGTPEDQYSFKGFSVTDPQGNKTIVKESGTYTITSDTRLKFNPLIEDAPHIFTFIVEPMVKWTINDGFSPTSFQISQDEEPKTFEYIVAYGKEYSVSVETNPPYYVDSMLVDGIVRSTTVPIDSPKKNYQFEAITKTMRSISILKRYINKYDLEVYTSDSLSATSLVLSNRDRSKPQTFQAKEGDTLYVKALTDDPSILKFKNRIPGTLHTTNDLEVTQIHKEGEDRYDSLWSFVVGDSDEVVNMQKEDELYAIQVKSSLFISFQLNSRSVEKKDLGIVPKGENVSLTYATDKILKKNQRLKIEYSEAEEPEYRTEAYGTYSFEMPEKSVDISAEIVDVSEITIPSQVPHGHVSYSTDTKILESGTSLFEDGITILVKAIPDSGYSFEWRSEKNVFQKTLEKLPFIHPDERVYKVGGKNDFPEVSFIRES